MAGRGGSIFAILGSLHGFYTLMDLKRPRRIVPDDPAVMFGVACIMVIGIGIATLCFVAAWLTY